MSPPQPAPDKETCRQQNGQEQESRAEGSTGVLIGRRKHTSSLKRFCLEAIVRQESLGVSRDCRSDADKAVKFGGVARKW